MGKTSNRFKNESRNDLMARIVGLEVITDNLKNKLKRDNKEIIKNTRTAITIPGNKILI